MLILGFYAGFPIRYRLDGKLLNLRRLQVKSTVQTKWLEKFLNVTEMADNAKTDTKMQGAMDSRFSFKSGNCLLIDPVPVHCFPITFTSMRHASWTGSIPVSGRPNGEPTITVIGQIGQKFKFSIILPVWEALFPEQYTLMMRKLLELRKQV